VDHSEQVIVCRDGEGDEEEWCPTGEQRGLIYCTLCDDCAIDTQLRNRSVSLVYTYRVEQHNPSGVLSIGKVSPISPLPSEQSGPKIVAAPSNPMTHSAMPNVSAEFPDTDLGCQTRRRGFQNHLERPWRHRMRHMVLLKGLHGEKVVVAVHRVQSL
jgi:hypothetical protein